MGMFSIDETERRAVLYVRRIDATCVIPEGCKLCYLTWIQRSQILYHLSLSVLRKFLRTESTPSPRQVPAFLHQSSIYYDTLNREDKAGHFRQDMNQFQGRNNHQLFFVPFFATPTTIVYRHRKTGSRLLKRALRLRPVVALQNRSFPTRYASCRDRRLSFSEWLAGALYLFEKRASRTELFKSRVGDNRQWEPE